MGVFESELFRKEEPGGFRLAVVVLQALEFQCFARV
jgi:hypothetical protein